MKKSDEALNEIRKIRHTISEEHGHDPKKLVNYYIELQKQHPHFPRSISNQEQSAFNDRSKIR